MHFGLKITAHRLLVEKYSDAQPRWPKGNPQGGQWKPAGAGMSPMHDLMNVTPTTDEEPFDYEHPPAEYEGIPVTTANLPPGILARSQLYTSPTGEGRIMVTTNTATKAEYGSMDKAIADMRMVGHMSSGAHNHIIWHELGHVKTMQSMSPEAFTELGMLNEFTAKNTKFASIATSVSGYGSTNGSEFIAEVYAGQRAGRKFRSSVTKLRDELLGSKGNGDLLNKQGNGMLEDWKNRRIRERLRNR